MTSPLFAGLFDDAALFPPAATELPDAVRAHAAHRLAWYADMVGPFVCTAARVPQLDERVSASGLEPFDLALVVPDGLDAVSSAVETVRECTALRLRSVEVPLGAHRLADALRTLTPLREQALVYLEVPVVAVTERHAHELSNAGVRLKLRTGGTSIDAFRTEAELAAPILLCAAERLAFKCTSGLHNAVRHQDRKTLFEHHGFLNIALAARVAAATENLAATTSLLAERDSETIARRVGKLTAADIAAIRALFASFGTCSIADPIGDLLAMGLVLSS